MLAIKIKKEFARDFKAVYTAINEEIAYEALEELEEKWNIKYPFAIKSWDMNWDVLSSFFKFPNEVRTIMYTTNIIESLHR